MKLLLLTQWFDPEPAAKGITFARELRNRGFDVEVVTGFPNYPGGRLYPGYRLKIYQREIHDGITVVRLPLYPSHDSSAIRRVINYVSFGMAALIYLLFRRSKPAVIYAYHPPLTVGLAAAVVQLARRIPMVIDIQDLWPDTLQVSGMMNQAKALRAVGVMCDWVYRRADRIVVLSPGFRRLLMDRGVPEAKLRVIYNWCDEVALANGTGALPANFPQAGYFRIVFAGNMGTGQGLDTVLDAAQIVATASPQIRFILVGEGIETARLIESAHDSGLHNVVFVPRVPSSEVGAVLRSADALLVHLVADPLFKVTIPSKTQAYMSVGRPILMAVSGEAAEIVESVGCGVTAEPGRAESIANAAITLSETPSDSLAEMGRRGAAAYAAQMSLRLGVDKFADVFREAAQA